MPEVGFEPMITVSARAKIVHTLDRAATVTLVNEGRMHKNVVTIFWDILYRNLYGCLLF
jgi:hypothetical protein